MNIIDKNTKSTKKNVPAGILNGDSACNTGGYYAWLPTRAETKGDASTITIVQESTIFYI
jgi:hypothetical protein